MHRKSHTGTTRPLPPPSLALPVGFFQSQPDTKTIFILNVKEHLPVLVGGKGRLKQEQLIWNRQVAFPYSIVAELKATVGEEATPPLLPNQAADTVDQNCSCFPRKEQAVRASLSMKSAEAIAPGLGVAAEGACLSRPPTAWV